MIVPVRSFVSAYAGFFDWLSGVYRGYIRAVPCQFASTLSVKESAVPLLQRVCAPYVQAKLFLRCELASEKQGG